MATEKAGFDFAHAPILECREALERTVEEFERVVQESLSRSKRRTKRKVKKAAIQFPTAKGTSAQ
jgi:hypothetical protein